MVLLPIFFKSYVAKGKRIAIEGKFSNRSWDDKEGKKYYTTEIICNELLMF
ncbi:single-stranded DNA-binding protein [uncultured Psychroserpens sp.]|uniref:single-stranded DNA-binding protein n=1 Tax=uncultured Psychroserpens sp. TaxID=255436 RepID=UPI003456995E